MSLLPVGIGSSGGYTISRSVRLRSSASAYFNRTFGTPTSGNIFTWSGWVKRGAIGSVQPLFLPSLASGEGASFNSSNQLVVSVNGAFLLVSTPVYRDPSAWYHITLVSDMGNATAALRFRVYVNGVEVTAWATNARASYTSFPYWNKNAVVHYMGYSNAYPAYADGYITEVNFIDGQALTPSSFGETNALTGVWQPKRYAGTYGTNGFYLNFSDNSGATATTIGKDYSGNGNNWTPNNISVTAGVTYDSMLDVPTLYADGGNGRGNYPVWNALNPGATYTNGNLSASSTNNSAPFNVESTVKTPTTGKWYAEITVSGLGANNPMVGIGNNLPDQFACYRINGTYVTSGAGASSSGTPATFTTNDVIGVAYDADAGTVTFYKNGVQQAGGFTGVVANGYSFVFRKDSASGDAFIINFGQRPFSYTPPTGFRALNTQNLPEPTIVRGNRFMDATTYTGNGSSQSIVNSGTMQPDLVWIKNRGAIASNSLIDAVRGANAYLYSDLTNAEGSGESFSAFNANGFSLSGANARQNANANIYVAWQWNAGGSTVTNTSGSISAQVRANATAGFSEVTYTGTGTTGATVGHGLGVAPKMIIVKNRSAAAHWPVGHASLSSWAQNLYLSLTNAAATVNTSFNSTAPSSTVFTLGPSGGETNFSGQTFVAYCFAEVAGYSKFGKYTGNGSADGSFVYLGFRPRWVMFKRTDTTSNWLIIDSVRGSYNADKNRLFPNLSNAEDTSENFDFLSNGFKLRDSAGSMNASGGTYIFAAFAENPFKHSLAR